MAALKQTILDLICTMRRNSVNIFTGLLFGGLASAASFNYFHAQHIQPYSDVNVVAVSSTVPQGGPLVVRVSGTREIICAVTVARAYTDRATNRMVHQELVPAGFVPLGPFSVDISMKLPEFLGPGKYTFRGMQINDCGDENITNPYPSVNFEISK